MKAPIDILFYDFDQLRETLSQLKKSYQKNLSLTVGISAQHSMTSDIKIENNLSDSEIIQFLKSRAMELFGHPADQLCIDYEIQSNNNDDKQIITAAAARAEFIATIEGYFSNKKINIQAIQVNKKMNLLPWRERKKQSHKQKIIFFTLLFSILLLFLCIIFKYFLIHETQLVKTDIVKISENNTKIILDHPYQHRTLLKKLNQIHAKKILSQKSNQLMTTLLADIANDLPDTVTLATLTIDAKKIKLTGISNQLSDIHAYAHNLKQTLPKKQIQLSEINNDQQNKIQMDFTMRINN